MATKKIQILGSLNNGVSTGDGKNSIVIGDGQAIGDYSLAGGTNDPELTKNLVWTTDSAEPIPAEPSKAIGDGSIAYGTGAVAHTTGSTSVGMKTTAGAKGFYWYDYEETSDSRELLGRIDDNEYEITQDIIDNGIIITDLCTEYHDIPFIYETDTMWSIVSNEVTDCTRTVHYKLEQGTGNIGDTFRIDYYTNGGECPNGISHTPLAYVVQSPRVKVCLSLTQPRISYNPEGIGEELDDGTWEQERDWSDEAQELLEGWAPNEEGNAVISFYGGTKHTSCSMVLEVLDDGYIIVDTLPDPWEKSGDKPVEIVRWDDYLIYCPLRPECGVVDAALGSIATGLKTNASGMASFAQGFVTSATGSYAVATGMGTEASYASFAGGNGSKALNAFTFAHGLNCEANGDQAFAAGHLTKALAESAVALNSRTTSNGKYSTAMGRYTTANGSAQVVLGRRNVADVVDEDGYGQYIQIVGNSKDATPSNAYTLDWDGNGWFQGNIKVGGTKYDEGVSVALISDIPDVPKNIISGNGASSLIMGTTTGGNKNAANGSISLAVGTKTVAGGNYSFAGGNGSVTSADQTIAFGHNCKATAGSAVALGRKVEANHSYSTAFGNTTKTGASSQTVVGKFNDINSSALFVIGNGAKEDVTDSSGKVTTKNRSNAMTVDESGNAWIAGDLKIGGTSQDDPNAVTVLTTSDMNTIVANVIAALPNGDEVSY